MGKMIQLRNVPDAMHRKLKARAAMEGMSLSEYLVREVRKIIERPTMEEILQRIQQRTPVAGIDSAAAVRRERDSR